MKSILLQLLSDVIAVIITVFGIGFFMYFLIGELSISTFLLGFVGYMFGVAPTVQFWREKIGNVFKKED
jgi:hypothetical protein